MDTAVAFVQAYLHINGYFTVTEYPIVEAIKHGGYRTSTDLDVLAVRFPHAARLVASPGKKSNDTVFATDPLLDTDSVSVDMIIGEVKEGRAELNHGARDPLVLRAVLTRFGCCPEHHVATAVDELLHAGIAEMSSGHSARLVAFGSTTGTVLEYACQVISLKHVFAYTRAYIREHWNVLRHAQFKDQALSTLMLMEKSGSME